jgi:hypothetical protein
LSKRQKITSAGGRTARGIRKLVQPLRKTINKFLKKLKTELPYDPKEGTCMAETSTLPKKWKQPTRPRPDKQKWYTYTMEYYLVTCNNMDRTVDHNVK